MTISFTLGLSQIQNELILMQSPGCYWVTVDRQEDARLLVRQIVAAQPGLALIDAAPDSPECLPAGLINSADITFLSLPATPDALQQLTVNLTHNLPSAPRFLLFFNHATLWEKLDPAGMASWLKNLNNWLSARQSTILIITCETEVARLRDRLENQHELIDGLSLLEKHAADWQYRIRWWRYQGGELQNKAFALTTDSHGFTLRRESKPVINDALLFLASKNAVADLLPRGSQWTLFDDNHQLARAAEQASAATLVFSVASNGEVVDLASHVHALRCQRGSALKIVIRETRTALRYSDERLLLACGVNAVIPVNTPDSRFLAQLDDLQGQMFNRFVPASIAVLLKSIQPLNEKGFLPPAGFCRAVTSLLQSSALPVDGKGLLIALQPVAELRLEQVLSLCQPRRFGDLLTTADRQIWLFLSSCRFNDLSIALKFIFRQPWAELVTLQSVWYGDAQIADELRQLAVIANVDRTGR